MGNVYRETIESPQSAHEAALEKLDKNKMTILISPLYGRIKIEKSNNEQDNKIILRFDHLEDKNGKINSISLNGESVIKNGTEEITAESTSITEILHSAVPCEKIAPTCPYKINDDRSLRKRRLEWLSDLLKKKKNKFNNHYCFSKYGLVFFAFWPDQTISMVVTKSDNPNRRLKSGQYIITEDTIASIRFTPDGRIQHKEFGNIMGMRGSDTPDTQEENDISEHIDEILETITIPDYELEDGASNQEPAPDENTEPAPKSGIRNKFMKFFKKTGI